MNERDIQTLEEMKTIVESQEANTAVTNAQIHNPSRALETSLSNFLVSRLERIESDADFTDLLRMAIRTRIPEMTIDQIIKLLDDTSRNNNDSVDKLMKMFRNETSGKTVLDHYSNNSVENAATRIYDKTNDKDMLQALNYLAQVLDKESRISVSEAEIVSGN